MYPSSAFSTGVEQEIQPQLSGQGMGRPQLSGQGMGRPQLSGQGMGEKAEQAIKDQIFQASMENKWTKVQQLYTKNEFVRESKLTRSEDTALHLAIASYHPDRDDSLQHPHLTCIKEMIDIIRKENRLSILKQKNEKGNTPLHLAAELGSVPIIACLVNSKDRLIWETNSKGETPLFITAYRGKLPAFLYLHKCVQDKNKEGPIELCRRKDGDNILHAAISGEYFGTTIEEIELMIYEAKGKEDSYHKLDWNLPENYQRLVEFLELLWNGTWKILGGCQGNKSKERLRRVLLHFLGKNFTWSKTDSLFYSDNTNKNQDKKSQGHQSDRQNDPENPPTKDTTGATNQNQEKKSPGLQRIKKIKERKRQHTWGVQIMKLMIEKEERYKFYESTGEKPEDRDLYNQDLYRQIGAPPTKPPTIVDDDNKKEEDLSNIAPIEQSPTSSTDTKKIDDHKSELSKTTKETPLLVASKMGIVEMVKRILKKFPIAIQDTDSDEKNILLLAVEHRQTDVYNWFIGEKHPEYVFYQVDKNGNNAVHLAAMFQKLEVWRIPGTALQLQGERKWYKYVKHTLPPQSYVRYNNKGQTPRQIYRETHAKLLKDGSDWLVTTANSFSVVAALIATVAFATSAAIPGGADDNGHPHLKDQSAFDVFSISSLVSLCFSVTALVFFLAILTSRCQHNDFEKDLPRKLLLGLTSLFASITAILVSFCAAHFFVLWDKFKNAAFPIYGATCIPVVFFAFNQFPLYVDLIRSYVQKLPLRSYKVFYTDSTVASSSDQKKEGNGKDD
ncbi:hypothetical protein RND71_027089 [Anisodus tanguticus]|uniref:PGG domain-containing protein n=1 Tax=Anisodus tanguticus TaxID=243964 RepID=A0AAE1VBW2_9SOLA|nr:hypothetical protein RND71_027089 [Anisodus tanguticus]